MEESVFWRQMNPARLHALYDAWFGLQAAGSPQQPLPEPPKKKQSLYEYLSGR